MVSHKGSRSKNAQTELQQRQEVAGDGLGVSGEDVPSPTGTAEESPPPKDQPNAATIARFIP